MATEGDLRIAARSKIDTQISAAGGIVDIRDEKYLKQLIRIGSKDKQSVSAKASGLQFFIVRGAGDGTSKLSAYRRTPAGVEEVAMVFDDSDMIAVFDAHGKLINSAFLRRPTYIFVLRYKVDPRTGLWKSYTFTESTANKVYAAWDGRPVSLYYNTSFDVKYYGLWVDDSLGYYKSGTCTIDMHKEEGTLGCIFIKDPTTPSYTAGNLASLNSFEPKFIRDIQSAIAKKQGLNIGTMHMVYLQG